MNEVTITFDDTIEVFQQDDIVSPKFDCNCYFGQRPQDYVKKIAEEGLTTVTNNQDGTHTYRHINGHCICNVEFTPDC